MKKHLYTVIITSFFCFLSAQAQELYTVDISKKPPQPVAGQLKLGSHINLSSHSLDANSFYFIKDGTPWYPVMGEFHFSRFPHQQWEESILKMKAAGIDVISTYVFWIYHEEKEGEFTWKGNNDLRHFVELCAKHHLFVVVRIGPWCHGEARNGGLPDWIVKRRSFRKNDPAYLSSVMTFYKAIAKQLTRLYFKDGGPIIGAQIENEFRFNSASGLDHMLTLKRMALEAGIDVPFYTATAWQGANLLQDELLPVWGGYPEAPWDKRTTRLPLSENYLFSMLRNDPMIGNDLLGQRSEDASSYRGYRYPYATAEMGGGIQVTYHRRPIISPLDVVALAYTKLGSGANLMGYYMFHGGSHAIGQNSTLQESRATNYPNDYPIINYDFQAPVGEYGQLRASYRWFKVLHSFLNHFGDRLVQYYPYFPDQKPAGASDSTTLRFAVRAKGDSGFIIISNYQRQLVLASHKEVQIQIKLPSGNNIKAFDEPIAIPSVLEAILPFNMNLGGARLVSATLQPLTKLDGAVPTYVFFQPGGLKPAFVFERKGIQSISAMNAKVDEREGKFHITLINPGMSCMITIHLISGKQVKVLSITQQQALDSWVGKIAGKLHLLITPQTVLFNNGVVQVQSTGDNRFELSVYPNIKTLHTASSGSLTARKNGVFSQFSWHQPFIQIPFTTESVVTIDPFENKDKPLPADDRNDQNTESRPGAQYQTNLQPVKNSRDWRVHVPPIKSPAFLVVDYSGDTGAAYIDGKLFADDFYYGNSWQIGLPASASPCDIILQVVPLTPQRDVYFETEVKDRLNKYGGPLIRSVKLQHRYTTELKGW